MEKWRDDLSKFFQKVEKIKEQQEERTELAYFLNEVVTPAFEQIRVELEKHGRVANIRSSATSISITVLHEGDEEMMYRIQARIFPNAVQPYADVRFRERKGLKLMRVESNFHGTRQDYKRGDITQQDVIEDFLKHYTSRV